MHPLLTHENQVNDDNKNSVRSPTILFVTLACAIFLILASRARASANFCSYSCSSSSISHLARSIDCAMTQSLAFYFLNKKRLSLRSYPPPSSFPAISLSFPFFALFLSSISQVILAHNKLKVFPCQKFSHSPMEGLK